VTYLPILFVCLVGGECDFIFAKPVSSRDVCETMNAESELRLEQVEEVVAYKSACIPVSKDHGPRT
jgi:hypothetical protein